ncbi:MAG: DUF2474 domain-containing protein [Sneathiella sp.]|nr:MAG: DUF2474 domain-containing protein [Sneathiella sp.]
MPPLLRQSLWFVGLWIMGVAAVGSIAFAIRLFLIP